MRKIIFILFFICSTLFSKTTVGVATPTVEYIVEKITLKYINTKILLQSNLDKNLPTKKLLRKISKADIYFSLNLPEEKKYLSYFKQKELKIVDLTKDLRTIKNNPYVWTDPLLFRQMAKRVYDYIVKLDKSNEKFYKRNLEVLLNDIDNTFIQIKHLLYNTKNYNLFVYENKWDYFAKRFRLNLYKQKMTFFKAKDIPKIIKLSKTKNIKKIIISPSLPYEYPKTLSSNTNSKIIENNIYLKSWNSNLIFLTRKLIRK